MKTYWHFLDETNLYFDSSAADKNADFILSITALLPKGNYEFVHSSSAACLEKSIWVNT